MTTPLVPAPELETGAKLQGPISYFPSIIKTYGRPIQEWLDIAATEIVAGKKHGEVVALLKADHGMGHGHANAVVAYARSALGAA